MSHEQLRATLTAMARRPPRFGTPTPRSFVVRALFVALALSMALVGCAPVQPTATQSPAATAPSAESTVPPLAAVPTAQVTTSGGLLQKVKARGKLNCGVDESLPGFSSRKQGGAGSNTFEGFNADFCRVVAAAIFGDPDGRIVFFPLSFDERFTALITGKVDVIFGNTSWLASADAELPLDFGPTTYYDSLAVLVPNSLGIAGWEELGELGRAGRTVCVERSGFPATRVEAAIGGAAVAPEVVELFAENGITLDVVPLRSDDYTYEAYLREDECDAVIGLQSRLTSRRSTFGSAEDDHAIIQVIFDTPQGNQLVREPLGPVFLEGDSQWRDVISWSVYATIQADEYGINQGNLARFLARPEQSYRIFLGDEGALGRSLGLQPDFARHIVEQVGSYSEIFKHNLAAIAINPGPNKVWNRGAGGVLSSPPFR